MAINNGIFDSAIFDIFIFDCTVGPDELRFGPEAHKHPQVTNESYLIPDIEEEHVRSGII